VVGYLSGHIQQKRNLANVAKRPRLCENTHYRHETHNPLSISQS